MLGLPLVAASGGHSSSWCAGLSLSRLLLLRSTGSRHAGSVVVAHGPSCSAASGIFPDQGSNLCPLHWQADSQPLRHQGSPVFLFLSLALASDGSSFPEPTIMLGRVLSSRDWIQETEHPAPWGSQWRHMDGESPPGKALLPGRGSWPGSSWPPGIGFLLVTLSSSLLVSLPAFPPLVTAVTRIKNALHSNASSPG